MYVLISLFILLHYLTVEWIERLEYNSEEQKRSRRLEFVNGRAREASLLHTTLVLAAGTHAGSQGANAHSCLS